MSRYLPRRRAHPPVKWVYRHPGGFIVSNHSVPEERPEDVVRRRSHRRIEDVPVEEERRSEERRNVPGLEKLVDDLRGSAADEGAALER
jgi:hypothetical protein